MVDVSRRGFNRNSLVPLLQKDNTDNTLADVVLLTNDGVKSVGFKSGFSIGKMWHLAAKSWVCESTGLKGEFSSVQEQINQLLFSTSTITPSS